MGAKVSVLWGMAGCTASGALLVAAAALHRGALAQLYSADREPAGAGSGREPGLDRSDAVGHYQRGPGAHRAGDRLNGISTYGGMALAAPLGVVLDQQWGLASIGLVTIVIGAAELCVGLAQGARPGRAGRASALYAMCWAAWRRMA